MSIENINTQIRKDLFYSFAHSQGNPYSQTAWLSAIGAVYIAQNGVQCTLNALHVASKNFMISTLPSKHLSHFSQQPNERIDFGGLASESIGLRHEITQLGDSLTGDTSATLDETTLNAIAHHLVASDTKYQQDRRGFFTDPHASLFRQYVLLGTPAQSPAISTTYETMRRMIPQMVPVTGLARLAVAWEDNHPGAQFDPHDVLLTMRGNEIDTDTQQYHIAA